MGERLGACICAEVMSLPVLTKQNIILIDHDNKSRRVHVQEWRLITCQVTPAKRVFAASYTESCRRNVVNIQHHLSQQFYILFQ